MVVVDRLGEPERAATLARRLGCPLLDEVPTDAGFVLLLTEAGLSLQAVGKGAPAPLRAEFVTGKAAWRRGQGELIHRAVKLRGRSSVGVVDATAGLGRDGFVLASGGFRVTMLERDPIVHALLADGLARAAEAEVTRETAGRITLHRADLMRWAPPGERPDVVYLDPMFPQRQKSAKVKKEMGMLQALLAAPDDEAALLERALTLATIKVVVKRPLKAQPLGGRLPSAQLKGRSTRFDIYPVPR